MKELAGFLGVAVTHPVFIGIGIVIACAALAGKLDDWLNKETKDAVALRLLCLDRHVAREAQIRWPKLVTTTLDGIFGDKHWSRRCFVRSAFLSILAALAVWAFGYSRTSLTGGLLAMSSSSESQQAIAGLALIVGLWFSFNAFADYVSLWETRTIIRWLGNRRLTISVAIAALLLDVVATSFVIVLVFAMVGTAFSCAFGTCVPTLVDDLIPAFNWTIRVSILHAFGWPHPALAEGLGVPEEDVLPIIEMVAVPVMTTFLTSLWVWAVIGGASILRLLARIAPAAGFVRDKLDIEKRPFRSLGVMAGVAMVLPYWVFKIATSPFTAG